MEYKEYKEVDLISPNYTTDELNNQIPGEPTINTILCYEKAITRNEFYSAAVADLKPEVILVVKKYEYNGERKLEYENTKYHVMKTYPLDTEEIELTCERVGADG